MALPLWGVLVIAGIVGLLTTAVLLVMWWYITVTWLRPAMLNDKYIDVLVWMQISNFWLLLGYGLLAIPGLFINATFQLFSTFYSNTTLFFALGFLATGSLVWNAYSAPIIESWYVVRQCYIMPILYGFGLPVFNICVMVYDASIPIVDFYVNLHAFYWYGFPLLLFKCSVNTDITNVLAYFSNLFNAFFLDLNNFFVDGFITAEWNIISSANAFGLFVDTLVPVFNCFCLILNPLWVAVDLWCNLPSFQYTLNCLWNSIIRTLQLVLATLQAAAYFILPGPTTVRPIFTNITNELCCTWYNAGDLIEDTVFITMEMLWGVFVNPALPPELLQFLKQPYMLSLSSPLCAVTRVANMTATLLININSQPTGFLAPSGAGIGYLQFGFIKDELAGLAVGLSSLFYLFNIDTVIFVRQLVVSIVGAAYFILDWILGNLMFFIYAGPTDVLPNYPAPSFTGIRLALNFLFYYFPNYWLRDAPNGTPQTLGGYTYSSAFNELFMDTLMLAEATGNLVGLINNPLGCGVEHLMKLIIQLAALVFNLISFFITIFTFQSDLATTAHAINIDPFFLELTYFAGCVGELVSQFGNCTVTQNRLEENLFCCTGELITRILDIGITFFQQMMYFFLDIVTLPSGTLNVCLFGNYSPGNPLCVRIPNMAEPIYQLNLAIDAFACALANIIPVTILFSGFDCVFTPSEDFAVPPDDGSETESGTPNQPLNPLPVVQCGSVTSCIGNVIASVLQVFTVPLTLLNQFFIQMIVGNPFTNLYTYLATSGTLLFTAIGKGGDSIAILIDCAICAFAGTNGPMPVTDSNNYCSTTFYTIFHYVLTVPFIALASTAGALAFFMTRLTLGLISSMFAGQGFVALQDWIVNMFRLMGIVGYGTNFWLVTLLGRLGLWELGSIVNAVYFGVCDLLSETLDLLIVEATIITLGIIEVPPIFMCCDELFACVPFEIIQKRGGESDVDMAPFNEFQSADSAFRGRKRQFPVVNNSVYLTPNTWIDFIVTTFPMIFTWAPEDACHGAMATYAASNWSTLTVDNRKHTMFCVYKKLWFKRTDGLNWTQVTNDTCNDAMADTADNDYLTLSRIEKSIINDCIMSRFYLDKYRQKLGIAWLPQDFINFNRRVDFLSKLLFSMGIYFQYMVDRETSPAIVVTPAYQIQWANHGFNVSFYEGVKTTDDVLRMNSRWHLADYFAWNGHSGSYTAAAWLTTTFWSFISTAAYDAGQFAGGMSDSTTLAPTTYMSYAYSTNKPSTITSGLWMNLLSQACAYVWKFAAVWADPATLKKRDAFFKDVNMTYRNVMRGGWRQIELMTLEWYNALAHNASIYYGSNGTDPNETRQFMLDYEKTVRGLDDLEGQHSILYRLGGWWEKLELPSVSPIAQPRDGKFRGNNTATSVGTFYHTYIDHHTGEMKRETILERVYRWTALVRAGTAESTVRYNKLTASYTMLKNRVFSFVIKSHITHLQKKTTIAEDVMRSGVVQRMMHTEEERPQQTQYTGAYRMTTKSDEKPGDSRQTIRYTRQTAPAVPPPSPDDRYCNAYDVACIQRMERSSGDDDDALPLEPDLSVMRPSGTTFVVPDSPVIILHRRLLYDIDDAEYALMNSVTRGQFIDPSPSRMVIPPRLRDSASAARALLHIDGLLDLTCTSNNSFLCAECLYLDQLVGRVLDAINIAVVYYTDGQYADAMTQSADFFAYEADVNANARFGDSRELPALYPWVAFDNLRILGDTTPNKLRFNDILNATNAIVTQYDLSLANSSLVLNTAPGSVSGIALQVIMAIPPLYQALEFFYNTILFIFSPAGITDATTSGTFIFSNWMLCDWNYGTAYNGLHKRFSIGEMFALYIVVFVAVMFLGILVFKINLWMVIVGTSLSLMIWLFTYLNLTYNWAWLCWPGLPYMLMKDINYFFVNTLFTKCDWYFVGPILNRPYTNSVCYACSFATTARLDTCSTYFPSIVDNAIFLLEYFAPGVIQWLRDTTSPLYIIYQIPAVNQALNQYATVDLNDPYMFAKYWACVLQYTLVTNAIIGAFVFTVAALLYPIGALGLALALLIFRVFWALLFLMYYILEAFFVMLQIQAFFVTGIVQTTMAGSDGMTNAGGDGSFNSSHINEDSGMQMSAASFMPSAVSSHSGQSLAVTSQQQQQQQGRIPVQSSTRPTMPHDSASMRFNTAHSQSTRGSLFNPIYQQQHPQRGTSTMMQNPVAPSIHNAPYNDYRNGQLSMSGLRSVFSRTRMAYFGADKKTK